jgi:nitrogen fixation NifU-like protein
MGSLSELYQNVILEHNRSPRNYRAMAGADRQAHGSNPLCGDQVTVWLRMDGDVIREASFQGLGCAISRASASLMTSAVAGKTRAEAEALFGRFQRLVTGTLEPAEAETLGKLAVFSGVSAFPMRVKCASLAWHAMREALNGGKQQTGNREPEPSE